MRETWNERGGMKRRGEEKDAKNGVRVENMGKSEMKQLTLGKSLKNRVKCKISPLTRKRCIFSSSNVLKNTIF